MIYYSRNIIARQRQQIGQYQLGRRLGQGSSATVYLGEHVYLHTAAAVKILLASLVYDQIGRFLTEARTLGCLVHPNIVRVLDFDIENTIPFIVMDYAPGGSLRQRYAPGSHLPFNVVASHVNQVAAALQYAHDQGTIHRDVKPENILLGRDQEILLSDFGIAVKALRLRTQHSHNVIGTPIYMAPEHIYGYPQKSSDQYSLAIVAFEWLTGSPPFTGSTGQAVLRKHIDSPVPSLRARVPSIPRAVERVIQQALSKDPRARFATVTEFANALEDACFRRRWWLRLS